MALMARISRLLRADLHAVLDRLEEPASLLRQSIRDMEDALAEQADLVAKLGESRDTLRRRLRDIEAARDGIDTELDLCFEHGDDALARKLVRRKLETAKHAAELRARLDDIEDRHSEAEARLESQRTEFGHLRQKADCLAEPATAHHAEPHHARFAVADDEVEVALLREQQRRGAP